MPQGSLNFYNGRAVHSNQKYLHPWRKKISAECADRVSVMSGPVDMDMRFVLAKPRTVKRDQPIVRPDLDKLVRAVLDALTGVAYEDDSQVVRLSAAKQYGPRPGVFISLRAFVEPDDE